MYLSPFRSQCPMLTTLILLISICIRASCQPASDSPSYIVKFAGYYDADTRQRYLREAFSRVPINGTAWHRLDPIRPGLLPFSDFSLIEVADGVNLATGRQSELVEASINVVAVYPNRVWRRENLLDLPGSRKLREALGEEDVQTRRLLAPVPQKSLVQLIQADKLWRLGLTGKGVKVAVLDTGLPDDQPKYLNAKKKLDWTSDAGTADEVGHGAFVAGLVAGKNPSCPGIAPDADLHVYRVFTNAQVSYTSWFLDAFNYAILDNVDVINLSIGGPDFTDHPFVEKVSELTANGVTFVSAIGNEGPLFGTLNNPADQMDVVGVGALNYDEQVAKFSARGMTTWELPDGYGRLKPDLVTYGTRVSGPGTRGNCRVLSGTSVASPVVSGVVALLLSAVKGSTRPNPAVVKQALLGSARRLQTSANMFEQGHGAMDPLGALKILLSYHPQASLSPSYLDTTECPYMWPYCSQPLFYGSAPLVVNVTVLNGMGVYGTMDPPVWVPYENENGRYLAASFHYSKELWPYTGWLAVHMVATTDWDGIATGHVEVKVESDGLKSSVLFPVRVKMVKKPPREKRVLWDQFHSLRYPPGYFPRDNLKVKKDPLDWHGDHIHTNFRDLYQHLRSAGYFVDVLGAPFTCFDASSYSALIMVDPEEEYFPEEINKLREDVDQRGLNLILFADWFSQAVMKKIKFFDENTKLWWQPHSGGSNVPALNRLLSAWNISLGASVLDGEFQLGNRRVYFASGTNITSFPAHGLLVSKSLNDHEWEMLTNASRRVDAVVLGIMQGKMGGGSVGVFGDSSCLDSSHAQTDKDCFWLMDTLLDYFNGGQLPADLASETISGPILSPSSFPLDASFARHSRVISTVDTDGSPRYRPLPECPRLKLSQARFSNSSYPDQFRPPGLRLLPFVQFDWELGPTEPVASSWLETLFSLPVFAVLLMLAVVICNRKFIAFCLRHLPLSSG